MIPPMKIKFAIPPKGSLACNKYKEMNILGILLMAPAEGGKGGGGLQTLLMFGLIFVVFYFFMIRPQTKKAKAEKKFREGLNKGDKVMTIGGMYGHIESLDDNTALVKVDTNTKIRFDKSALKPLPEPAKAK